MPKEKRNDQINYPYQFNISWKFKRYFNTLLVVCWKTLFKCANFFFFVVVWLAFFLDCPPISQPKCMQNMYIKLCKAHGKDVRAEQYRVQLLQRMWKELCVCACSFIKMRAKKIRMKWNERYYFSIATIGLGEEHFHSFATRTR